jgi:putative membrane protein
MTMPWHEPMNAGGWVLMVVGEIVIWGLIIAFVIWLLRNRDARQDDRDTAPPRSAREILDRRLASGEIDSDEYERLRRTLSQSAAPESSETGRAEPSEPSHPRQAELS